MESLHNLFPDINMGVLFLYLLLIEKRQPSFIILYEHDLYSMSVTSLCYIVVTNIAFN